MPENENTRDTILITSWLEPDLVGRIRADAPWATVEYHPDLLRPPRYPADHTGRNVERSPFQEARWLELLGNASILYDIDPTHRDDLPELAPGVRWIQATSAGIGQLVRRLEYARRMPGTVFTTASGVHAGPLAEFVLMAMLAHTRGLLAVARAQSRRTWTRFAGTDLEGRTVLVVGYGAIGSRVGRLARTFGMRVLGVKRHPGAVADLGGDRPHELHPPDRLPDLLPGADFLVLTAPHTEDTEGLIGEDELAALPPGAVVVNVARGALVDESALERALTSGHLGGAYLDVFAEEPLPPDSPLWGLPNVLIFPHSGSTSDRENARITDLFCENLRRWQAGRPLLNVLDTDRLY
jgi:phosphoglycerate dehydrogenase-like enzyme